MKMGLAGQALLLSFINVVVSFNKGEEQQSEHHSRDDQIFLGADRRCGCVNWRL